MKSTIKRTCLIAVAVAVLACGCTTAKMESTSVRFDPKTGNVTTNAATAKVWSMFGGQQALESVRASGGVTASVGAKGVEQTADMSWLGPALKLIYDAAFAAGAAAAK